MRVTKPFPGSGQRKSVESTQGIPPSASDGPGEAHPSRPAALETDVRFGSLLEQAPFSIQVFSPDGRTIRVNRAFEELWGVRFEQMQAYNILEDPQMENAGIRDGVLRAFAGESVRLPAIEYDPNDTVPGIAASEDSRRWLSAVMYPIKDAGGLVSEVVIIHEDITARVRAEEERSRSERNMRSVLESISDGFFALDADWRFTYVNPQAEVLVGRNPGDLLGRIFWEEFPGAVGNEFETCYRRVASERVSSSVTSFYAEHERWYEVQVYPATPGGISAYFRDVTERVRAEEEVARLRAESEQQRRLYEAVLSNSADFHFIAGLDARLLYTSWPLLTLLGKSADYDVTGRSIGELGYPDQLVQRLERQIGEVVASGQSVRDETPFTGADGERHYEYILSPVIGRKGSIEAVAGSSRDITGRKQSEEALRESERLYRAIGESIDFGVWVCDPEGRNIYASESFLRLVGLTQEQCREFGWGNVLHPEDAERTMAEWKACVESGEQWDIEHRFRGVDGTWHPILARGVPVRNEHGRITAWAGINLDISRQKLVQEELREADRRKDEFLATLAHELRNPLAPIRNSLEILKMPGLDPAVASQTLEVMERQVYHMVRLVDDLIDVSRVMRGRIDLRTERTELGSVVTRAIETAKPLIDYHGHRLELDLPAAGLHVLADPVRMTQVVGNLLTNAAKYTESGGTLRLSVTSESDEAVLRVSDNGIGIDPAMLSEIFDLFVQVEHGTSRSQSGLGVGLTLVAKLVALHGGSVAARSDGLGTGSEFVVRLPLVEAARPDVSEETRSEGVTASGLRILVVDDNEDAADSLAMLLRLRGHDVAVANDGPSALEMAAASVPNLVLLDIGMPGMDGCEVARRIRKHPALGGVVLAALTGWGQKDDRRRTADAGFDHHLVKPVELDVLATLLASAHASAGK
jgi:PAS domain S-box-containing protein